MKRQEILKRLREIIPSFHREFIDKDYFGHEGWLMLDNDLPPELPPHFLEGIEITRKDGFKGTLMRYDSIEKIRQKNIKDGIPDARKVVFSYMNYPGYPHRYGSIKIYGVELVGKNKDGNYIVTGVNKKDIPENYPELKWAKSYWQTELGRIVTEEDVNDRSVNWNVYKPGNRTQRFTTVKELRQTAVYVALLYVQGAFYMEDDHNLGVYSERRMLEVNDQDEVTFYNGTEKTLC